ncbi:MAG: chemotaxis protein CheD [Bacteroidia bacterium]|jgi:chemotaxis protein CheD
MSSTPFTGQSGKCIVVGVGDMKVASVEAGALATNALGSCMGLTAYDPIAKVGGILHYMLVRPRERESARANPYMFALSGIPALFRSICEQGGQKERLIVCAAGGAEIMDDEDGFSTGKRNHSILRKLFWENGIVLHGEDCGGHAARNMTLDLTTGKVTVTIKNEGSQLWPR